MKKPVIGVINWDASLPSETFFGFHVTKSLSPNRFRNATPYYADIIGDERIDYHYRTQEEDDRELQYAIDAGIDYFAYCWYGSDKSLPGYEGKLPELNYARSLHMKSRLADKLKLCAIIVMSHPWLDEDYAELIDAAKEDFYQKIEGRPAIFLLGGYDKNYIKDLRRRFAEKGAADPYITFLDNWVDNSEGDYSLADAASSYSGRGEDTAAFADHVKILINANEERKKYGISLIPHFSTGWDPSPRIVNPVPWGKYPQKIYAPTPNESELLEGAKELADWIKANKDIATTGHILTFAWNEFEEGGWICPTINGDRTANLSRLNAFKKVVELWKNNL